MCEGWRHWRGDGNAMTSTVGHDSESDAVQEKVMLGLSGGSTPAVVPKNEPDFDESCAPKETGTKRILSTMDPDYAHPPDTKRMREMHQRAQDELSQRVIKVVDKELHKAIMEKETEMEEIDTRILKVQQCLHTLRYCVSLSYYNTNKGETQTTETRNQKVSGLHPTIQRHLGKTKSTPQQTSEFLTTHHTFQHNTSDPKTDQKGKQLSEESQSSSQPVDNTTGPTIVTDDTRVTAAHSSSDPTSTLLSLFSHHSNKTPKKSETGAAKEAPSSQLLSPKYLPPLPPDNTATISQGRQERLQNKRRLIIGNTYQYLAPLPGEEMTDSFRYKWQLYVRAPPSDPDASTFLQSVTFSLDHSYAPHHMITIKQPPFVLRRRGWGEFKVQVTLRFIDQRNKPICLLHPLVLSRPDDALALTGLWRLGQENWFDLWVYLPNPDTSSGVDGCAQIKEDEFYPATLIQELETGVISSQVEENITVDHEHASGIGLASEHLSKDNCAERGDEVNEKSECVSLSGKGATGDATTNCLKKLSPESFLNKTGVKDEEKSTKEESEGAGRKEGIVNGQACTVYVRQSDDSLKPYLIPSHLYPVALQMARNYAKQTEPSSSIIDNKKLIEKAKSLHGIVQQGADCVAKGNKGQHKDTVKSISLKLFTHQSASSPSSNVVNVTGGVGATPEGTIHLVEAGSSEGKLKMVPAATDTATTTCPQHLLLQNDIKEKKLALVQKQLFSKFQKPASISDSLRLSQVQMFTSQTPSRKLSTNAKHVNEVPVIRLPQPVHQNHIAAGKVKFMTSNGQLLTAKKLKDLGLQVHIDVEKSGDVTSSLAATTTATSTAVTAITINTSPTSTSTSTTGALLIQGGRVVAGANTLQLITSQGKMAVKQLFPLKKDGDKASNTLVQPMKLNKKRNVIRLKTSTKDVFTQCDDEIFLKGKDSSNLERPVNGAYLNTDSSNENNLISGSDKEQQLEEEQKEECSTYWEDYLSLACEACKTNISPSMCVSLLLKVIPLIQPSHLPPSPYAFCRATSNHHFLSWPLAKQRACEFQRAKEVKWWLEEWHVKGWERWTVPRVVAWARSHAHTPINFRPVLCTDKLKLPAFDLASAKSLSHVGDLHELEQQKLQSDTACIPESQEVDVMGYEEGEESQGNSKRLPGSPLKRQLTYLQWEEPEMSSACEWVGQLTSQLRLSLYPEEMAEGYVADAARATLWKAVLSLMEDLLRAAHFKAWNEATDVPPNTITLPHVLAALITSRPEFDIFTDDGLGTPSEAM